MADSSLPALIQPGALEQRLEEGGIVVVDLSSPGVFVAAHVPGAVNLEYAMIVSAIPPVGGLLPEAEVLSAVLGSVGIGPETAVVACDDEGNGKAGRLLWTLDAAGHRGPMSMLDGGMRAWINEGFETERGPASPARSSYAVSYVDGPVADKPYILERMGDHDICLLDTRTPEEFDGSNCRASRCGHIPGAVNFNWVEAMDTERNLRLRHASELAERLAALGATPDREVIAYCHTHHRSSHTYWLLRWLGFERVKGYPGAWSDWGNDPATPVSS